MDLFDRFERRVSRFWDLWDDEWRDFETAFNKLDTDEIDKEKNVFTKTYHYQVGSNPENNYSMSYHYETGMDEPEINIHGNPSQDTIDSFLDSIKSDKVLLPEKKLQQLKGRKEPSEPRKYELAMPGIGKEDISYEIDGNKVKITGKRDKHEYHKVLRPGFKPDKVEISSDNGLVEITIHPKKTKESEKTKEKPEDTKTA